ncbi:hypothetical protein [Mesonia aquimarina]|uniref:hypothetical protein n=1 Tax=Mesonia aquimarina TaxID=1504967 RepID=UPI000EF5BC64|nr:hypothetical protein [Mesonia aquimarina]
MKKILLFSLLSLVFTSISAQIKYEKGYIIRDDNSRVECLIKNEDWENNPTSFKYKLTENASVSKGNLKTIKEFGDNAKTFKFVRGENVKLERKSNGINTLGLERRAVLKEETLFLRALVEGEIDLYRYVSGPVNYYFYKKNDRDIFVPLIYKKYITAKGSQKTVRENNRYKNQLASVFSCKELTEKDFTRLDYHKKDLVNLFTSYHQCINSAYTIFKETSSNDEKAEFKLTPKIGANYYSLEYTDPSLFVDPTSFDKEINFTAGIELEYIFPFNRGKWSAFLESRYSNTSSEVSYENPNNAFNGKYRKISVDYSFIQSSLGARHRIFLSDKAIIFVNAAFVFNSTIGDAKLEATQDNNVSNYLYGYDISSVGNFAFGAGLMLHDFQVEIRYNTATDLLNDFGNTKLQLQGFTFLLGYTLF